MPPHLGVSHKDLTVDAGTPLTGAALFGGPFFGGPLCSPKMRVGPLFPLAGGGFGRGAGGGCGCWGWGFGGRLSSHNNRRCACPPHPRHAALHSREPIPPFPPLLIGLDSLVHRNKGVGCRRNRRRLEPGPRAHLLKLRCDTFGELHLQLGCCPLDRVGLILVEPAQVELGHAAEVGSDRLSEWRDAHVGHGARETHKLPGRTRPRLLDTSLAQVNDDPHGRPVVKRRHSLNDIKQRGARQLLPHGVHPLGERECQRLIGLKA
mmetsp:Transcript_12380/g.28858  ORF Transcript_12380/g.28858 Transcript_12380/m.28858 type:complete len:263 (+) Transcript_12380:316-1104(+)